MAAGMQHLHIPHIPNEPIQPTLHAPPVYGAIHYEGAVDPHNFNNAYCHFAPNPAPPLPALPEPNHQHFNVQFQHHLEAEHEQARHDLYQRQAQEAFHREHIQRQLQQQEAECLLRQAQEDLALFHLQQQQGHNALHIQQQQAELIARQAALRLQHKQQEEAQRIYHHNLNVVHQQ
ncbi:hypothetical protein F4604DRAFT_1687894 [Suillus subluteus]|nr:hypothetical protein F4604DRAFT_1687894 [Suillus subluteus]